MKEQYVSGEEYRAATHTVRPRQKSPLTFTKVLLVSAVVGAAVIGIAYAGMKYEQTHNPSSPTSSTSNNAPQSGTFGSPPSQTPSSGSGAVMCSSGQACNGMQQGGTPPIVGTITAVSASSITIQPNGSSATKTFSITSSTEVANGPNEGFSAYNASNFHVGETVGVAVGGSGSTQAEVILPNYQTTTSNQ